MNHFSQCRLLPKFCHLDTGESDTKPDNTGEDHPIHYHEPDIHAKLPVDALN